MDAALLPLAQALRHMAEAVIVTDVKRRITWVNPAFEQVTGYRADEAIGRGPAELLQFEGTDRHTIAAMRAALDALEPYAGEVLNLGRRAHPYWVHLQIHPMRDDTGRLTGFLGIGSDITARKDAEAALRASEELLRGAFEAVGEALALFGPDERLVFCNRGYFDLNPCVRDEIVPGVSVERIVRLGAERGQFPAAEGRVDEWVAQRMAAFRRGGHPIVQQLSDGRILRVVDRKMAGGYTVVFRVDITELVRATESAESADRSKSEFIATISHELRTPLQVIIGYSDLGRHFAQDVPQFKPMFDDIHGAGIRMLALVNGLLDMSKITASVGSLALHRKPLAPMAESVARELARLAEVRGLRFDVNVPAALVGDVDTFRFEQVLRNVMANALRFAPAGTAIEVGAVDHGPAGVDLTVTDRGPGIPPDELESIFEPFVQSSRTRDGAGGTGLGLAICRRIMGAHGGRIVAEAPPQGGACFRIWLPPASPEPQPVQPETPRRRLADIRASARAVPTP